MMNQQPTRTQRWYRKPAFLIPASLAILALVAFILLIVAKWMYAPKLSIQKASRARSLMFAESYEGARRLFDEACSLNSDNIVALRGAVWSRLALEEYESALEHADAALQVYPNDMSLHEDRGDALSSLGRWPQAIEAYQTCIMLDPSGYWEPWMKLAAAYRQVGDVDAAMDTYRDLLSRYAGHTKAQEMLATLEQQIENEGQ